MAADGRSIGVLAASEGLILIAINGPDGGQIALTAADARRMAAAVCDACDEAEEWQEYLGLKAQKEKEARSGDAGA